MKRGFPGVIGKGCTDFDAVTITETYYINGGGPSAFGGASRWPVLKIEVCFEQGREDKRAKLMEDIEKFLRKRGTIRNE